MQIDPEELKAARIKRAQIYASYQKHSDDAEERVGKLGSKNARVEGSNTSKSTQIFNKKFRPDRTP